MNKKPIALIIMDGFGIAPGGAGNAIALQGTPELKRLAQKYPHTQLQASGLDVGLPDGQMGNSEVGHLNIGAGRIVYQDITRIDAAVKDGGFFRNPALTAAMDNAVKTGGKLHIMGLLSDGGVHSHIEHILAVNALAKRRKVPRDRIFYHCFMDGRDVSPTSGDKFLSFLEAALLSDGEGGAPYGRIASIMGRYYIMDRDNRWERVAEGYNCMTAGTGKRTTDIHGAMRQSYAEGVTDEFIKPITVTDGEGNPIATVDGGDSVIFCNFRSDRAREVSRAFLYPDFDGFKRAKGYTPVYFVGMTQYDATFGDRIHTAFAPQNLDNTLGAYLAALNKTQLRIAETEKYAHVTFFFNGGVETPNAGEDRVLVPSPKVATYDLQPEMSAPEVTAKLIALIEAGKYDVIILNYANCDMVGHTGVIPAAVKAVETVDNAVGRVTDAVIAAGGCALITADHGNADQMLLEDGSPCTAHTTNPVPFILAGNGYEGVTLRGDGKLCDIAPTILDILKVKKPAEMTGATLIKR